ncbi:DUF1902 domain-containing protein [Roseateles chitosanitabidus]|nr:DUF1902 domain-containing protein [Roseateles chitosanitabidus]
MNRPLLIHAEWDPEAAVWVATSHDVPGLATEADTLEALESKLSVLVPELLEANGCLPAGPELAMELLARRVSITPIHTS